MPASGDRLHDRDQISVGVTCVHPMPPGSLASIPSPSFNQIELGPLSVHVYGLMYVFAVLAAVAVTTRRERAS
jgi:hypothetical protein